jgi:tubulin polyglutamylase TTLL1
LWILKPCGKSQGKGVFLINKLNQFKKWAAANYAPLSIHPILCVVLCASSDPLVQSLRCRLHPSLSAPKDHTYVISRYIASPLLISQRKFDLRLYVLVTRYRPLRVYRYALGFARFCGERYSMDAEQMENVVCCCVDR